MISFDMLSSAEQQVYKWLTLHKIPFDTQVKMFAGYTEIGGSVVDFIIPDKMLALRIMGVYWHSSIEAQSRDRLSRERLTEAGYHVVDIWEDQLTDDKIDYTMNNALQGVEIPR